MRCIDRLNPPSVAGTENLASVQMNLGSGWVTGVISGDKAVFHQSTVLAVGNLTASFRTTDLAGNVSAVTTQALEVKDWADIGSVHSIGAATYDVEEITVYNARYGTSAAQTFNLSKLAIEKFIDSSDTRLWLHGGATTGLSTSDVDTLNITGDGAVLNVSKYLTAGFTVDKLRGFENIDLRSSGKQALVLDGISLGSISSAGWLSNASLGNGYYQMRVHGSSADTVILRKGGDYDFTSFTLVDSNLQLVTNGTSFGLYRNTTTRQDILIQSGVEVVYWQNGVNKAPVNLGVTAQTVDQGTSLLIKGLSVVDVDGNLASTQLGVTNGTLSVSLVGGASISAGSNNSGSLTLAGTEAQINAALATLRFQGNANFAGTANLSIVSRDSASTVLSDSDTMVITVTGGNEAPVLANSATLAYTENASAAAINTALTVSDVDNATLASATVSIQDASNNVLAQDVLSFTNTGAAAMGNIAGTFASGVLTLTSAGGSATQAQWQAALRAVAYSNTSDAPSTSARTVRYVLSDGNANSNTLASTVNVTAVNDAPVLATGATLAYTENQPATAMNTAITVADVDNATLASGTVSITSGFAAGQDVLSFANVSATMGNIAGSYNAATGVMTLTSSGSSATQAQWQAAFRAVQYSNTSESPSSAARTVSYVVNDGSANSAAVTSTINVTPVFDFTATRVSSFVGQTQTLESNYWLSSTITDESAPVVVKLSGGGLFMAWYTDGEMDPAGQVFGMYLDDSGKPLTASHPMGSWRVNGDSWISMPSLTAVALADNRVAVGWQTENSTANGPSSTSEVAYALASLSGSTISVSKAQAFANTEQTGSQSAPVMVATSDGGFFMAWFNADNTDPSGTVTGRYFNADGSPRTGEFNLSGSIQVNGNTWVNDSQPPLVATALANGKVAVAWVTDETTLMSGGIGPDIAHVVVGYTGSTGSASAPQRGNNTAIGNQGPPVIAATGDGGYFMAWYSSDYAVDQGPLRGQYFDANGAMVGTEQSLGTWGVHGDDIADMHDLTVKTLANNMVVVGWQVTPNQGVGAANTTEAAYILVGRTGTTVSVGTQALLNTTTTGNQSGPAIGKLANGGFFAAWYDNSEGNPAGVVRGQYFDAAGAKVGSEILVSGSQLVEGLSDFEMPFLSVTVLDNDRVDVAWLADGAVPADTGGNAVVHTVLEAPYAWTSVSGVTEAGATVRLFRPGDTAAFATQTASASGAYSFTGLSLVAGSGRVESSLGGTTVTTQLHIGSGGANTLTTGATAYALVEGRQGNDSIDLSAGGQATLLFGNLGNDNTGNNGHDTVTGFTVGHVQTDDNADTINLADLLFGATPAAAAQYINVVQNGANAEVWVDRDGTGNLYQSAKLLTLNGVSTDLSTLLNNGQLVLPESHAMTATRTQAFSATAGAVLSNGVVNTSSAVNNESAPVVVKLSGGGFFMAWYEFGDDDPAGRVYGRYFDANGQAVGAQLTISTWSVNGGVAWANIGSMPTLTAVALADNRIALGWQIEDTTTDGASSSTDVGYALTSLSGSTASVFKTQAVANNTALPGFQSAPVMVATSDGGFFMAWFNADNTDPSGTVTGRYFNADGSSRTDEFNVSGTIQVNGNTWVNDSQPPLVATALADGKVALAWVSDETTLMSGGVGPDIAHTVVSYSGSVGAQTGTATAVQRGNNTATGDQGPPVIAATGDGGYFMAWYSADYATNQGPLRGQYFDATGAMVGAELNLGTWPVYGHDAMDMPDLTVQALGNNTVVVGWQVHDTSGVGSGNSTEPAYILVSRTGTTVSVGTQALMNSASTWAGDQSGPAIGKLANGGFFAAWYDNAQGNPAGVVRGQYFNAAGAKVGSEILVSGALRVEGSDAFEMPSLSVTVLDNDRVSVAWIADNNDQDSTDGWGTAVVHTLLEAPYAWTAVSGVTTPGAEVTLFQAGLSHASQLADASTGAYNFTGLSLPTGTHQVVSDVGGVKVTTDLWIGSGAVDPLVTGTSAYALVEGRQGHDSIDITNGGRATLLYSDLGHDNTGNNGHDTVSGFTLGSLLSNPHADVIDLSGLLSGATVGTASQFVSIVQNGANAQLWVDRDGSGSAYSSALLLTLNATTVDLSTLLNNQQLVLG